MSNKIMPFKTALPALPAFDRRIRHQAAHQMQRMAEIAEVTKAGMKEIGDISAYAEYEAVRTLVNMNLWEQAGRLSPEEKQQFVSLKTAASEDLKRITQISSEKIIALIESLPPEAQHSLWDEIADWLDR